MDVLLFMWIVTPTRMNTYCSIIHLDIKFQFLRIQISIVFVCWDNGPYPYEV